MLWFLVEEEHHLVDLLHLLSHLQSPTVPVGSTNTHVHTERVFKVLIALTSHPLLPVFTIVSIPLILRDHVTPYPQPMVNHDHHMRTPFCPLEVVAKFDVLGVMPVTLPSTVLMEGFFVLTMLLCNWLEQRTKFRRREVNWLFSF